jgi:hypothetical protein
MAPNILFFAIAGNNIRQIATFSYPAILGKEWDKVRQELLARLNLWRLFLSF